MVFRFVWVFVCFICFLNYVFAIALNSKIKRLLYQNSHLPRRKKSQIHYLLPRDLWSLQNPQYIFLSGQLHSQVIISAIWLMQHLPANLYNQLVSYEGILGFGRLCRRMNTVQMFRCPDPTDFCYVSHLMEFSLPCMCRKSGGSEDNTRSLSCTLISDQPLDIVHYLWAKSNKTNSTDIKPIKTPNVCNMVRHNHFHYQPLICSLQGPVASIFK